MSSVHTPLQAKWEFLSSHAGFRHSPASVFSRLLLWRMRCWLGWPATVRLARWDVRLRLPPVWRGIAKLIYTFGENYERELPYFARNLSPGMTVVDVGAAFGIYTLIGSRCVGDIGRVVAFEPTSVTFQILTKNLDLNQARNVQAFAFALSDREGHVELYHYADSSRNSLGREGEATGGTEPVRTRRMDDVLRECGVDSVQVMKVDAEGAEELVFRGAARTLEHSRPMVLFEVNPQAAHALDLSATGAWDFLKERGYAFSRHADSGDLQPLYTCPAGGNIVALPGGAE